MHSATEITENTESEIRNSVLLFSVNSVSPVA